MLKDQKINLRLVMVDTDINRCSKATISSAETMLPLMFRHSKWLSLKAFASNSMSSIIIKLFEMSKSFRDVDCLRTSASMQADLPEILTSDM